ncbi:12238_t:CDS:2 [Funneliformis caledonium]|uniref:12238_t:CDS:1 n=1 Tax=Funneliformis caledonium TaxID=1117310 RepID=A0A9N9CUT5_9GLOM|nr:12238_t:CDS:2 [Funneliformis caledonium]
MRGKYQKIKSLLGDEDIYQMITEYLWCVGCNVTVGRFKIYIKQEIFSKKGVRLSLHVSDFLTEVDGRLKTKEKEACVIMKPGINHDGW